MHILFTISLGGLLATASPTSNVDKRQLLSLPLLDNAIQGIQQASRNLANPYPQILSVLESIKPGKTPTSIPAVYSILSSINAAATPRGYFEQSAALIAAGLAINDFQTIIAGSTTENNATNNNPPVPSSKAIYPTKGPSDAPYSASEQALRQQIYIPTDFTYGKKPPVLLIPGTGERAGNTYAGNLRKLLRNNPYADPVLLNYPGYGLADCQDNAEVVAYAINYVAAVTGKNVSAIAWSQGNINVQWVSIAASIVM